MLPPRSSNQIKSGKTKNAESHTSPTKYGMGFNYGSGLKQPIGKIRDSATVGFRPVNKKKLKTPPTSVV